MGYEPAPNLVGGLVGGSPSPKITHKILKKL